MKTIFKMSLLAICFVSLHACQAKDKKQKTAIDAESNLLLKMTKGVMSKLKKWKSLENRYLMVWKQESRVKIKKIK